MTCQWGPESRFGLDLTNARQLHHLTIDAQAAEDIAIRAGGDRAACLVQLFSTIADIHHVTPQDVLRATERRDPRIDLGLVLVPAALAFVLVSDRLAAVLYDRIPIDNRGPALLATLFVATIITLVGIQAGGLWATFVEMIRLQTTNLGFRQARIPWFHYVRALMAGGVLLFCLVAWRRARLTA